MLIFKLAALDSWPATASESQEPARNQAWIPIIPGLVDKIAASRCLG